MKFKENRSYLTKKIVIGILLLGIICAGFGHYYYFQNNVLKIVDFNALRDTPFILERFQHDWYWLTADDSFSPQNMLESQSSSKKYPHNKDLFIKMAYKGNKPVGFVIYYQKRFYLGHIRFIDLDPEFRSQGWAAKLLDYAVKDLIKRGVTKITLLTRTNNYPAQKLYTRYGFKETRRDDNFVDYEYLVPQV